MEQDEETDLCPGSNLLFSTSRGERGLEMVYGRPKTPLLFSKRRGFALWGSGEINIGGYGIKMRE
jgi:hypothetical protein